MEPGTDVQTRRWGGSRRAWGSRRCRLAGRVRDFTVPFAQTIGALAPRPRRTGARDSRAGCQRIRECRDTGAGREGARSHREVGRQAVSKSPVCGIEAPVGVVVPATQAPLTISSERSGAE
jgi:hypothetical protein